MKFVCMGVFCDLFFVMVNFEMSSILLARRLFMLFLQNLTFTWRPTAASLSRSIRREVMLTFNCVKDYIIRPSP